MTDIDRSIGEVTTSIEYMKEQLDHIATTLEKQQDDIDTIKIQMAELRGSHKAIEWIRSIFAGLIGAIISTITLFLTLRGVQ